MNDPVVYDDMDFSVQCIFELSELETSDWQDSTDRVSSCSWVRISQRAGQTTGPTSSDVCSWMACV